VEEPGTIYFTGTAGAGKTSLVRAFAEWTRSAGYDAAVVNLDPGSEASEDAADVDIREWVRLADLQDEYGLGPNGAQVVAADMIALKVFEVKQAVQEQKADYILIDTPGQIELFAFREASKAIVDALSGDRSVIAFLYDPVLARTAAGFVSLLMLGATVEFRFRLPTVNILAKSDVLSPEQLREVMSWSDDPGMLYDAIGRDTPTRMCSYRPSSFGPSRTWPRWSTWSPRPRRKRAASRTSIAPSSGCSPAARTSSPRTPLPTSERSLLGEEEAHPGRCRLVLILEPAVERLRLRSRQARADRREELFGVVDRVRGSFDEHVRRVGGAAHRGRVPDLLALSGDPVVLEDSVQFRPLRGRDGEESPRHALGRPGSPIWAFSGRQPAR